MPVYEYHCPCGQIEDVEKPYRLVDRVERCKQCGQAMKRFFVMPNVAFGYWKPQGNACTPENALAEARLAGFEDGDE